MAAVYTGRSHMSVSETLVSSNLRAPVKECKSIYVHCQLLSDEAWLWIFFVFYSSCQLIDTNYYLSVLAQRWCYWMVCCALCLHGDRITLCTLKDIDSVKHIKVWHPPSDRLLSSLLAVRMYACVKTNWSWIPLCLDQPFPTISSHFYLSLNKCGQCVPLYFISPVLDCGANRRGCRISRTVWGWVLFSRAW